LLYQEKEKIWLSSGDDPKVVSSLINFSNSYNLIADEKS